MRRFNNILTLLLLLLIVIGVGVYNAAGTYSNDDWWACFFLSKNLYQNFLSSDQGLVWSWFAGKIVTHAIPTWLHIHPQQNILLGILKGINFAVYILILSLFFNAGSKKIPKPLVVLVNTLLIFSIIFTYDKLLLFHVNQHYKYIFNLIIGTSIWFVWINEFLNNEFLTGKKIVRDSVFAILLAFAGHLVNIPTCFLFSVLFTCEVLKSENRPENLKRLLRIVMPMGIIYIAFLLIYINLPGFTYSRAERIPQTSIFIYSVTHLISFTKEFILHIFSSKYIYGLLIITIAGLTGLIFNRKRIDYKYIVVALSIFFANFAFQYLLITCGTTFYDGKSYWFASEELTATFLFYLILDCNIIYGCLFGLIDKKAYKTAMIVICFITINIIYPINTVYNNIQEFYEKELIQREAIYKINKICRYYALKDDVIYIPEEYLNQINILAKQQLWISVVWNLKLIYEIQQDNKNFKLMRGKVTNEEILFKDYELKHPDFKKLYDDNFILRMKRPRYR